MDNTKLIKIIEQVLEQTVKEEICDLRKDLSESRLKVSQLEIKLGIAYDELARTKEDFTRFIS